MLYGHEWEESIDQIQQLCDNIASYPFQYLKNPFRVTVTFGMCRAEADQDIGSVIARADKRLYIGKAKGKNQVVTEG